MLSEMLFALRMIDEASGDGLKGTKGGRKEAEMKGKLCDSEKAGGSGWER